ncbi:MAG: ATP-binding cassette domain-containing protein, partial [Pseudomonadota bacterium]
LDRPPEPDPAQRRPSTRRGAQPFARVRFRHWDHAQPVLQDISLTLRPGTVTALVGRSGSGKSTLARPVPRFYWPDEGVIRLDGVELADYSLAFLRDQVALVSQDVVLFNDTVLANIAYGSLSNASRSEVEQAARDANAWTFIDALPLGLDTALGQSIDAQDGIQLSGGQRQRIAIARALLKDAPLLILDEATSALDNESERAVQQGLARLMDNRTTLVIAHRLSTVEQADQVVVLDQGRIVECGRHDELLASPASVYQQLYRAQFDSGVSNRS